MGNRIKLNMKNYEFNPVFELRFISLYAISIIVYLIIIKDFFMASFFFLILFTSIATEIFYKIGYLKNLQEYKK